MTAALDFLQGSNDPEVLAELRAGMLRWLLQNDDPLPLHRMLGLGTPRGTRIELREVHLTKALALMPGKTRWKRLQALAEAARTFNTRRWPSWKRLDAPPAGAAAIDAMLWHAARLGGELPNRAESYLRLTNENQPAA